MEITCKYTLKNGIRCKRKPQEKSLYCYQHAKSHSSKIDIKNPLNLRKLSGCSVFAFYKDVGGKRILLLGESHEPVGYCTKTAYNLDDWLYDLSVSTNSCLDIFVEDSYISEKNIPIIPEKPMLFEVMKKFQNYKSDTTRYHRFDVRKTNKLDPFHDEVISQILHLVCVIASKDKIIELFPYKKDQFISIYSYILGLNRSIDAKHIYDNFVDHLISIFKGREERSKHDEIPYKLILKELSKMDSQIDVKRLLTILLEIYTEGDLMDNLYGLMAVQMDLYLLSRLFIVFDEHKMNRGPKGCQNQKVKTAIIYGGDFHITVYMKFFSRYFGVKPDLLIQQDGKNNCIKFDKAFNFFG